MSTRWLFRMVAPVTYALSYLHELDFHYIPFTSGPDLVEVWHNGKLVLHYNWIDGETGGKSAVGKIHRQYQQVSRDQPF